MAKVTTSRGQQAFRAALAGCASCGASAASSPAAPMSARGDGVCVRCGPQTGVHVATSTIPVVTGSGPQHTSGRVNVRAATFLRGSRRLNRLRRQDARDKRGRETTELAPAGWARLLGFLPVGVNQHAVVTFAAWGGGRHSSVEVTTGEDGQPVIVNAAAVNAIAGVFAAADAGATVMIQVSTGDTHAAEGAFDTIRAWVLNRGQVRAVDGAKLHENHRIAGCAADHGSARFMTGWPVTGQPGGARNVRVRRKRFRAV